MIIIIISLSLSLSLSLNNSLPPNPTLPEHKSHCVDAQEDELIQLYVEMCSHDDTIDRKQAAQCIARRLHCARRLNVTKREGNDGVVETS